MFFNHCLSTSFTLIHKYLRICPRQATYSSALLLLSLCECKKKDWKSVSESGCVLKAAEAFILKAVADHALNERAVKGAFERRDKDTEMNESTKSSVRGGGAYVGRGEEPGGGVGGQCCERTPPHHQKQLLTFSTAPPVGPDHIPRTGWTVSCFTPTHQITSVVQRQALYIWNICKLHPKQWRPFTILL